MVSQSIDLDARELLTLVHNALTRNFFQVSRTEAKQQFQSIAGGDDIPLMTLDLHSGEKISCVLALDYSEFAGNINFSLFREALASHLHRVALALKKGELNVFTNTDNHDVIFHHPGIIELEGQINVLVSGIEQRQADTTCIKLQFLDPVKLEEVSALGADDNQQD